LTCKIALPGDLPCTGSGAFSSIWQQYNRSGTRTGVYTDPPPSDPAKWGESRD